MSETASPPLSRAEQLRQAFDQSFTLPVAASPPPVVDLISVRLGADVLALRVSEINALRADVTVTPVPSPVKELIGIAGFGGTLTPVYDLPALLGYATTSGRWLALVADRSVALAFDQFEEHFRVEAISIAPLVGRPHERHINSIARKAERAWPIVDLASLVTTLKHRAAGANSKKE